MTTPQPVGVGDFVLLDKIDLENFMQNLEIRYTLSVPLCAKFNLYYFMFSEIVI